MYSKVLWDHPISFSTYWFLLKSVKDYNCPVDGFAKFALWKFLREFLDNLVGPSKIFYIPPVNAPLAGNLKLELENEMAAHYWKLDLVENRGQLLLFSACVITPASLNFLKKHLFCLSLEQKAWKKFLISFEIINPCLVWLSAAEYHPFTCHCKVWGSARNIQ